MATNSLPTSDISIVAEQTNTAEPDKIEFAYAGTFTGSNSNGSYSTYNLYSNERIGIVFKNGYYRLYNCGNVYRTSTWYGYANTHDDHMSLVNSDELICFSPMTGLSYCELLSSPKYDNYTATVPIFDNYNAYQKYYETGDDSERMNQPDAPPTPATPTITLSTPSLMAIGVFDPAEPYDVRFTYTDNQSVKNRLVITDPETYEVVYDKTVLSMKLLHTIPERTLQPNKCYTAAVQVFDIDDNKSNLSESALFYCYTKPVFTISDIPTVCKGASITLPLSYLQPEGETLKSYQFFMCDSNHNILNRSDTFYTDEHMHYSFSGLQNHYTYYFRVIGETTHGYKLDTGYFVVAVDYNVVPTNAVLVLENVYRRGYISIKTNIKSIGYELKNDNYFFEGDTVTLYEDNYVKYNEGFSLDGDFSLFVEAKKLPLGTFLRAENGAFTLSIVHVCDLYYCEFKADDYALYCPLPKAGVSTTEDDYLATGNGKVLEIVNLNYDDDDFIVFEVKRENSVCSLNAYHKSYALLN
ncbi:MAG: hypothetical protein K2I22_05615 [Lachnospiraceae bacterium]|nr:hypothetical protein [Lachnospiraceae bacterium]